MTQDEVSDKLGLNGEFKRRTMTRYEKGSRIPKDARILEIAEIKNNSVLQAQAYNKNYFDSLSLNIELSKGYISIITKVSYAKRDLKELYVVKLGLDLISWTTISDLCDRRNKNPLCHADCNVLMSKKDIEELNSLVLDILNLL